VTRARKSVLASLVVLVVAGLAVPSPAFANMGGGFGLAVFVGAFAMSGVLLQAIIIAVETPVLRRVLGISVRRSLLAATLMNIASAVPGLLLANVAAAGFASIAPSGDGPPTLFGVWAQGVLQFMGSSSWDPPMSSWVVFLSMLALLAVFFVCSVAIEVLVAKVVLRGVPWKATLRAVVWANVVSHVLLAIALAVLVFTGVVGRGI
jgi:hypothetical protein